MQIKTITKQQIRALEILKGMQPSDPFRHQSFNFRAFARKMWPDSPMHTRIKNTGCGACKGKAAWLCAGGYIVKLELQGLVRRWYDYDGNVANVVITEKGNKALADAAQAQTKK